MPSVSSLEEAAVAAWRLPSERVRVRIGDDLDAAGMDRVLEHEAGDLTCTVEAGIRLSALAAALAPSGQRLSLDPPGDPTIGACLAGNLSGPLRHRFGAPRDLVLGVTLVLADGTVVNAGGKVVKNVAGYDLGKLVCGSRGRLAFIGRVSLRLHPIPVAAGDGRRRDRRSPPPSQRCCSRSQLVPSAVDILHPGRVAVLFEGGAAAVAAQVDATRALVGGIRRRRRGVGRVAAPGRQPHGGRSVVRPRLPRQLPRRGARRPSCAPPPESPSFPHPAPSQTPAAVRALQERVRARFDPQGVLA